MKSVRWAALVVLAVALLTAGCGASNSGTGSGTSAGSSSATPRQPPVPPDATVDGMPGGSYRGSARTSSADWDKVVEAANREGTLTVYSNQNPDTTCPQQKVAFEKAYPSIKVDFLCGLPNGDIKIDAEQKGGKKIADIDISSDLGFMQDHKDYWTPLRGPNIIDSSTIKKWTGPAEAPLWTLYGFQIIAYAWNTDLIKGRPTLKQLLTDGQYKSMPNAMLDFTQDTNEAYGVWLIGQSYDKTFNDPNFVQLSADARARLMIGLNQGMQALSAGQYAWTSFTAKAFVPRDAPIEVGFLDKPPAPLTLMALTRDSPHPNAAQVFANWAMTREAQEISATDSGSALPGISTSLFDASQVTLYNLPAFSKQQLLDLQAYQKQVFGIN
ncbi:hypothetical protein [Conexibacter sp. CPCC 206217]|uniref:hypothetical protein n=1 Tax=Conexibacter sp. CPCC 206217 TaxID=3064574 RepID=UPI002715A123|nr:hypothetical protein [Conexibacter sp. CPCC 206217]MDO8213158.1 hypothetical protein [Conexibacter sp. CPCC 206217]